MLHGGLTVLRATSANICGQFRRLCLSTRMPSSELQKRNWKEDVVYLYQFKRAVTVPTMSPFCIKVETFLRANDIKYEVMGSWTVRSKEGRVPFIELNGQQVSDSQLILWHLIKHFKIDEGLSPEQQGLARAIDRFVEGSTYYAITYFRSIENAKNSVNPNVSGMSIPSLLVPCVANRVAKNAKDRLNSEGMGRHSRETIIEILRKDVQALDQILGEKKFLLGSRPCTPDFTVFGHLGVGYYLPFRQPITDLLDDEFPRVRLLLERIKIHYWKSMMGLFGQTKTDPKEHVRELQRKMRREMNQLQRQIHSVEREEEKVKRQIKAAAKKGDRDVCTVLAKSIIQSRKAVSQMHKSCAQINSIIMSMQNQLAAFRMAGTIKQSNDVMRSMQQLIKIPEMMQTMREMAKEMTKVGIMEEMIEETFESMEPEELEDRAQDEVDRILWEVTAGELGKAPAAVTDNLGQEEASKRDTAEADAFIKQLESSKS
ncbi:snf7 domain-containing protein [Ditylenchus destructor]|nr:snf7 domain-containing protein [Ditylenchus destructor]